ncbi:esterase-like activity of phytase family protein [Kordiimonas laminariae]|uniref:esterase-like activity of phytase family protein n=1 Tax=Kordiimonas laminariae TaxID=2917717 RepID=UPI001FF1F4D2|nr:esterase-like activity of phytase family protein [Kordiimonas laminariae]MCK0070041.1 esterase-like activity of phytase family protein [Kordiimonas laminariae]
MRNKLLVIGIIVFSLLAGVSSYFGRQHLAAELEGKGVPFNVRVEKLPLNEEDPGLFKVGELTYMRGWALTADNDDFGGFSGMVVEDDGKKLIAVNDKGDWFAAHIDAGKDTLFTSPGSINSFPGVGLLAKASFDAESIIRTQAGKYLISFEQDHRLMTTDTIAGEPVVYPVAADYSEMASNSGMEAIAQLPSGDLLLFAEHGQDAKGALPAWVTSKETSRRISFIPPQNYSPTDAAALPNGDVLLLMRHYSPLDGVSAKIMLLKAEDITAAGELKGRELAHIEPPYSVDNMEAMDIVPLQDGRIRIYMMSDDNFSLRQRTLLMVFDWQPS